MHQTSFFSLLLYWCNIGQDLVWSCTWWLKKKKKKVGGSQFNTFIIWNIQHHFQLFILQPASTCCFLLSCTHSIIAALPDGVVMETSHRASLPPGCTHSKQSCICFVAAYLDAGYGNGFQNSTLEFSAVVFHLNNFCAVPWSPSFHNEAITPCYKLSPMQQ